MTTVRRPIESLARIASDRPYDTATLPAPPPWTEDAACATTDPEIFFPQKGGTSRPAKKICATCPVLTLCRQYAIDNNDLHGVWGGLSDRERRKLQPPVHCQTCGTQIPRGYRFCRDHRAPSRQPIGLLAQVRTWARDQGIEVADRGNLAKHLVLRYLAEHPQDGAA